MFNAGDVDDLANKLNLIYDLNENEYSQFEDYSINKAKTLFDARKYVENLLKEVSK